MNIEVTIEDRASGQVAAVIEACGEAGRAHLHATAANAVANQIQRHIALYAPRKHDTARATGGQKTHHYESGMAAITSRGDATCGTVDIPIPGIQRAWKDLVVTPKNAKALTIPKSGFSYGHKVSEMAAFGWQVFRPNGKNVLLGTRDGKTEVLYTLAKLARQPKDPSLLPADAAMANTAAEAAAREIMRTVRKARAAA